MIAREKTRDTFDVTQPTWCRALFLPMAVNTRMLWTERGINWLKDAIIELAPLNATTASRMLNSFQHVRILRTPLREYVGSALRSIVKEVSTNDSPIIHGQATVYLRGFESET